MPEDQESIMPHEFAESVMNFITDGGAEDDTSVADTATAPETADTAEPELTADEHGNLHGPDGKFVGKATDTEEEQGEEEETSTETPEGEQPEDTVDEWELDVDDPDISSFLAKYDNDLGKALKGAVEAQKTLGRQGSEIGELRQLAGKVETLQQMIAQQAARPNLPAIDYVSMIETDPQRAAHEAARRGDVDVMVQATKAWGEEEPFEASTFLNNVIRGWEMDELRREIASAKAQAPPAQAGSDEAEAAKVLQKHPDLEKFLPAIGQVAQERPFLRQMLESGSPSEKASALEDLYLIARSRDTDTSSEAVKRIRVRAAEEGRQARADATVVSASRGSAASADSPTRVDQFLDAFDARMKERGLMGEDS